MTNNPNMAKVVLEAATVAVACVTTVAILMLPVMTALN